VRRGRGRRALLALYPAAWRRRHGDEVLGHLDDEWGDARLPVRAAVDLAGAAIVERCHGTYAVAAPGHRDATGGLRLVTWGWCCCVVGGIGFAKLAEHFADARFRPLGVPDGLGVAGAAYDAVLVLAVVGAALLALLVTPAAAVAVTHGGPGVRRRLTTDVAVAAAASAVLAGYLAWMVVWAHELSSAQRNGGNPDYGISVVGLALLFAIALAAWTNVANGALRVVVPARDGTGVTRLARAAALCVTALAAGALLWLAAVAIDAPGFLGDGGLGAQWPMLGSAGLLVAGAALSIVGAWRLPSPRGRVDATPVAA
jgi:hypothetical protein